MTVVVEKQNKTFVKGELLSKAVEKQNKTFVKGELLSKALVLMVNGHHGQFDRGGNPYALHPLAVMNILNSIAVDCLTKKPGQSYEEYVELVLSNVDAMRVKKADLTHNTDISRLKGIRDKDIERMGKYQVFYYTIQQKLIEMGEV